MKTSEKLAQVLHSRGLLEMEFKARLGDYDDVESKFATPMMILVRDRGRGRGGYKIEEATVLELHYHPGRHPWYPNGEGYDLEGNLWWTCYPGCRVFATRAEAIAARLSEIKP